MRQVIKRTDNAALHSPPAPAGGSRGWAGRRELPRPPGDQQVPLSLVAVSPAPAPASGGHHLQPPMADSAGARGGAAAHPHCRGPARGRPCLPGQGDGRPMRRERFWAAGRRRPKGRVSGGDEQTPIKAGRQGPGKLHQGYPWSIWGDLDDKAAVTSIVFSTGPRARPLMGAVSVRSQERCYLPTAPAPACNLPCAPRTLTPAASAEALARIGERYADARSEIPVATYLTQPPAPGRSNCAPIGLSIPAASTVFAHRPAHGATCSSWGCKADRNLLAVCLRQLARWTMLTRLRWLLLSPP